jgi:hypothetical protein
MAVLILEIIIANFYMVLTMGVTLFEAVSKPGLLNLHNISMSKVQLVPSR